MLMPALSFLLSLVLESDCGAGLFKSSQEQEQEDLNRMFKALSPFEF